MSSSSSPIRARAGARTAGERADLSEVPLATSQQRSSSDEHSPPDSPSSSLGSGAGSSSGMGIAASPMGAAHDASEKGTAVSSSSFSTSAVGPARKVGWCDGQRLLYSALLAAALTVALALVAIWVLGATHLVLGRPGAAFTPTTPASKSASHADPSAPLRDQSHHDAPPHMGPATQAESATDEEATVLLMMPGAIEPHAHATAVHYAQVLATETQRQRIEAHEAAVAAGRLTPRPKPAHEHGSGRVTHRTQHLFLRSAPRARALYEAPTPGAQTAADAHVSMSYTGFPRAIDFGVRTDADVNATAAESATPHLAAPFLVHVKSPCTHSTLSQLRTALSSLGSPSAAAGAADADGSANVNPSANAGGWHVNKYVHLSNYIVVPNDAHSRESDLLAELERNRPLVVSWHKYEEQDKIEPYLYENCNSTATMMREFERDSDATTFDLTVTLFHAAATEAHKHAHHAAAAATGNSGDGHGSHGGGGGANGVHQEMSFARVHAAAARMRSLHGVVPESTRRIVERWRADLAVLGPPYSDVSVEADAAHLVHVAIPRAFFHPKRASTESTSTDSQADESGAAAAEAAPVGCFCKLLTVFASYPHTEFIEQNAAFETHNKHAVPLIQSGHYNPRPSTLHAAGLTGLGQVITVADTGVAHGHCFFSDASVPAPVDAVDFRHRKIVSYVSTRGKKYDLPSGHGSHTAASIAGRVDPAAIVRARAAGDHEHAAALERLAQYGGVAFESRLAVFDVNDGLTPGKIKPPRDIYAGYYQLAYETMAARISSNSWGSKNGSYIYECAETDRFVWDHPDFLPIFSSGNYGERGAQSVVSPGTAKNALCVGAVANVYVAPSAGTTYYCPQQTSSHNNPFQPQSSAASAPPSAAAASAEDESVSMSRLLSFVSGSGLSYDTRFKPEVLAPGHYIVSARSGGHPDSDSCRSCSESLMALFGTSMSAAVTAGAAALARQYYTEGRYPTGAPVPAHAFVPSAALLKATLIHSAVPDTVESPPLSGSPGAAGFSFAELNPFVPDPIPRQTGPTPKSGFGRVQLDTVLKLATTAGSGQQQSPLEMFVADQAKVSTDDVHSYCFRIRSNSGVGVGAAQSVWQTQPLSLTSPLDFRATLVWSDPPAALAASWLLINNLDLSVAELNTGRISIGNQHQGDPSPQWDSVNNVEQVTLPASGLRPGSLLSVHVRGSHVPQGPQPYALLVTGDVQQLPVQMCRPSGATAVAGGGGANIASVGGTGSRSVSGFHGSSAGSGLICPSGCSGRGSCSATGSCECASGFGGAGCELTSIALPMCHSVRSSVARGRWSFFHFDVDPTPLVPATNAAGRLGPGVPGAGPAPIPLPSLRLQLQSLGGQPDLYVARGRLPTLQEHDFSHLLAAAATDGDSDSDSSGAAGHAPLLSQVDLSAAAPGRYFVGVYGYCCDDKSVFVLRALRCQKSTAVGAASAAAAAAAARTPISRAESARLAAAQPCDCADVQ